jgi:Tol biopolymer transport system component
MALSRGTRIGPYDVSSQLGAGGMGEVYRATDTKLNRPVALKVLLPEVAHDPARLQRFRREAQMLAALNHPNIAQIYGLEEADGQVALVMELVEGDEPRGPMPVADVVRLARQIAAALDAAHEKGIVHRDLKPGNIKVTSGGVVKVLDFGLARLTEPDPVRPEDIPTGLISPTLAGTVLGTPAYMAPEQARGKTVDKRADIWAFGVVLYELSTGDRLFEGETSSDIIAHVLTKDPELSRVPEALRPLVGWCLQKDTSLRLRDIADALPSMDAALRGVPMAQATRYPGQNVAQSAPRQWLWPAVAGVGLVAAAALAFVHLREVPPVSPGPLQFDLRLPEHVTFEVSADPVVSPDGQHVAFPATAADGARVFVQAFDGGDATVLGKTFIGPATPPMFWSPDSRQVVYSSGGPKMSAVDIATGETRDICDKPGPVIGGTWNKEGVIVFGTNTRPLYRVPATGGTAVAITALNGQRGETSHQQPTFLPDGRHLLYLVVSADTAVAGIYVRSIDDPVETPGRLLVLAQFGGRVVLDRDGRGAWLLYLRDTRLLAQRLDLRALALTGPPLIVPLRVGSAYQTALFGASNDAIVSRVQASDARSRLVWSDSRGQELETIGEPGTFQMARLSPDETRVAFIRTDASNHRDVWVLDVARGGTTRVTFGDREYDDPIWSPDGRDLVFGGLRDGVEEILRKHADGSGDEARVLAVPGQSATPQDWSKDGRYLLYMKAQNSTFSKPAIGALRMAPGAPEVTFENNDKFIAGNPRFSPDGRYVAYESDETGRREVYVRALIPTAGETSRWLVSTAGGHNAEFSPDGKRLFWVRNPDVWSADIDTTHGFQVGAARRLFNVGDATGGATFADSKGRSLFIRPEARTGADRVLTVLVNWQSALQAN